MDHEKYMKRCYELAVRAGKKGFDTFGAVLVHSGQILEEAENTADWNKGIFGHAEFNLVHRCANRYSDAVLKESTVYTSCAPCGRCLCAIASLGVGNVVFGVSYEAFSQLTPGEASPVDREGLLRKGSDVIRRFMRRRFFPDDASMRGSAISASPRTGLPLPA